MAVKRALPSSRAGQFQKYRRRRLPTLLVGSEMEQSLPWDIPTFPNQQPYPAALRYRRNKVMTRRQFTTMRVQRPYQRLERLHCVCIRTLRAKRDRVAPVLNAGNPC